MRRFERNSHIGMTGDFSGKLKELSPYCFLSDMDGANRELYCRNNMDTYENLYLIRKEFAQAIERNEIREDDIIFFDNQCDLKTYLIYFDRDNKKIGSLYKNIDRLIIELFEKRLNREFSDTIENTTKNIVNELSQLNETLKEFEPNIEEKNYISFVKKFFNILDKIELQPLLPISSTFLIGNDDYKNIIDFIKQNIKIVNSSKANKIKEKLLNFENLFEKNSLLISKRIIYEDTDNIIKNYSYDINFKNQKYIPNEINLIIDYAKLLWDNPSTNDKGIEKNDFNWSMKIPQIDIQEQLIEGFEQFKKCINKDTDKEKKEIFFELKRNISKAECLLKIRKYSEFVKVSQIFIETFFRAIKAEIDPSPKKSENQKRPKFSIGDKVKNIQENINIFSAEDISLKYFIESICICFKEEELQKVNSKYIKINKERDIYSHRDIGINSELFKQYLNYLVEEEFGHEDQTGLFYKWKEFLKMPDKNIFDQLNEKVLELLKKPDLLNENTYE